jgi:cell division protein FtsB
MTVFEDIRLRARHIWLTVFGALVLAYFSYHMIQGNHGVIALLELQSKVAAAEAIRAEPREPRRVIFGTLSAIGVNIYFPPNLLINRKPVNNCYFPVIIDLFGI